MKTRLAVALAFYWLGYSPPSLAQTSKPCLTPPVLGYVYDETSASVKAVMGVTGAASLYTAFSWLGPELHVAPGLPFGAVAHDGFSLVRWPGGSYAVERLSKSAGGPGKVVFSPLGRTAAVQWLERARVEVWSGLPGNPVLRWSADLEHVSHEATLAAVPDDGSVAVLMEGSGALRLSPDGSLRPAGAEANVRSVAFRPESRDLLVVMGGDLAGAILLDEAETVSARFPWADVAAFSSDGRSVVLASRESGEITMVEIATGAAATAVCDCRPDGLFRLRGNAVFRLSAAVKAGFPVFDGDASTPRIAVAAAPEVEP